MKIIRKLTLGAAAGALTLVGLITPVSAAPQTAIRCWIPQPEKPVDIKFPDRVRQRTWDGKWEYAVDMDPNTAMGLCTNVLPDSPGGVWVYTPDAPYVQAYLTSLPAAK